MSPASLPSFDSEQKTYEFIAAGTVSMIYALSDDCVLKRRPRSNDRFALSAHNIEKSAYKRLGRGIAYVKYSEAHTNGLTCILGSNGHWKPQRGFATYMNRISSMPMLDAITFLSTDQVISSSLTLLALGLDGNEALVCYEWCSYRPGSTPDIKTDIFAFGSTLFEIESGNSPFHELQGVLEPCELLRRAEQLFAAKRFPDVEMLQLKHVITRCWNGDYTSMADVVDDTAACCQKAAPRMASPYTCFHHKEV
ncbi:predicted protein [Aspergillus terreus NIH2624]|uniref:Protein kinase domain-containing protein n=1 Tax=Aspergillus terreus (strain NIH 2624 / FGSC A1156) TaxID=341663 RepID=Q0CFV2_ASPTN|nr:uncharacterized protein ATEG_07432 [Aspergillus terreus NIH2624]EAU31694.1 predicted protein [Aspergillus terreus NIH2624]